MDTVQAIVGTHHGPRFRFFDNRFKRPKINLAQCAFIHFAAAAKAVGFLAVRSKMFQAGANSPALHPLHISRSHLPCEIWIFTEIFEITPTQRRTLHIDARPQNNIDAVVDALACNGPAYLLHNGGIPGSRKGGSCRKSDRWKIFFFAGFRFADFSQAMRPI